MRLSRMLPALVSFFALVLAGVTPVRAGVVFDMETTYYSGSEPTVQTGRLLVLRPNLKVDFAAGMGAQNTPREMIYRGDRKQMIVIEHSEKAYVVIDPETIRSVAGGMSGGNEGGEKMQEAMKELERQMENLGPKEREMMEKMLKDKMPPGAAVGADRPKPEYRKTNEKDTVNGYSCFKYDVFVGKEKTQELWVTDWENIAGSKELQVVFEDMAAFYAGLMESLDKMTGGIVGADRNPMEDFANVEGFPVLSRTFSAGELESETALKSVAERDLDAAEFEVPKGYKQHKIGM